MKQEDLAFTRSTLEQSYGFQRSQNDWKKPVNMLCHLVDDTNDIHKDMLETIKGFSLKLLNQLMKEIETAMNQGSSKPVSIKFSKDFLAPARRLQEYLALIVDFVWRNYAEHSDMWKNGLQTVVCSMLL
jgi:hypothetical protein